VSSRMTEISAGGPSQNSSDDSKEVSPSNSPEDVDDYYKMILEECAKDCEYFDKEIDSTP
ncbi:12676_t:CDS:1, partial [Funneliformis geosporum]